MFTPSVAFCMALLLCIGSNRMLQATPVASDGSGSREARGFFPGHDQVHYYPEHHHHHHFADYAPPGFPSHHDAHYHHDAGLDHHQHLHHHHHDVHEGHYDQHYYY